MPPVTTATFVKAAQNKVLYPLSMSDYEDREKRSVHEIRSALRAKSTTAFTSVDLERAKDRIESTNGARDVQQSAMEKNDGNKYKQATVSDAV